jgi:hypothetical protein
MLSGKHRGDMAHEYKPGMKMYEAVWERDGERVLVWCMHAASEADVISEVEAFFAEHPEHEIPSGREGTTVRVGIIGRVSGTMFTNFKDMPDA